MMKKFGLPGLLVMLILLSACTSQGSTAAPAGTNPQAAPTRAGAVAPKTSDCTIAKAGYPTAGATESSLFLPITTADWTIGSAGASVTILEYSDFQ
ncbi:MAG TPA: hypothetical protein VIO61_02450 [Anaerolineaceae bacterium]